MTEVRGQMTDDGKQKSLNIEHRTSNIEYCILSIEKGTEQEASTCQISFGLAIVI